MLGRKLGTFSLQGVQELGGYTLAAGSALAFAYTQLRRGHTRIDFLFVRLPAGLRAALNTIALLALAAMAAFATVRGADIVAQSIEMKATSTSPLQTPLWIPQSLWVAGWALLALLALAQSLDAIRLLVQDRAALNRRYDPPTLDEEIRAELGQDRPGTPQ